MPSAANPDLSLFKVKIPIQVRFRDTDAMGHVNNAVYLSYLELARMEYWKNLFGLQEFDKVDFILARLEIDYRVPVKLGDSISVYIRMTEMGGSSFKFEYAVVEEKTSKVMTTALTVQAFYDYSKGKVKRAEESVRNKVMDFERGEK